MIKLLIVDDSNIIRSRIARIYSKSSDVKVIATASNEREALSHLEKYKPDIVTMDLTMPQMGGVECIRKMIKINPSINIIVVSALSDKETGIEALSKGARGFLCKPFTDEALRASLEKLISINNKHS